MNSKQPRKLMVIALTVLVSFASSPASAEEKVYFFPVAEKGAPTKEYEKKQNNSDAAEEEAAEEEAADEEAAEEEAVKEKPERRVVQVFL